MTYLEQKLMGRVSQGRKKGGASFLGRMFLQKKCEDRKIFLSNDVKITVLRSEVLRSNKVRKKRCLDRKKGFGPKC